MANKGHWGVAGSSIQEIMNLLNQHIQLAENTEDVLRLVADAWRAGGCPDTAYAIERKIEDHARKIEELEEEHEGELRELKDKHEEAMKELREEIKDLNAEIRTLTQDAPVSVA